MILTAEELMVIPGVWTGNSLAVSSRCCALKGGNLSYTSATHGLFERLTKIVEKRYSQETFTPAIAAAELKVSVGYMHRCVKANGTSFPNYFGTFDLLALSRCSGPYAASAGRGKSHIGMDSRIILRSRRFFGNATAKHPLN